MSIKKYQEHLSPMLKKLPVPDLQETLKNLLEWSYPLLSLEEQSVFEKQTKKFLKTDGPLLQKKLQDFAHQTNGNWLSDFWMEEYLNGRAPVQGATNFALVIKPSYHQWLPSLEVKASRMIYQLAKIYKEFVDGTYPLEKTKNGQQVDMSFYMNFFKTIRLPDEKGDTFYRGEWDAKNNFVLILKEGHYFKLNVTNEAGELYSVEELTGNIKNLIVINSNEVELNEQVHYLSGISREKSAELYSELITVAQNRETLQLVADALFVVSFNDFSDTSEEDRIQNMLLHPENQFFTKTMQLLVTKNGSVGFNFEHTAIDGVPTLTILSNVFSEIRKQSDIELGTEEIVAKAPHLVSKIKWTITDSLAEKIASAKSIAEKEYQKIATEHYVFKSFGKSSIKKAKISPDAFFHIALGMAQYEMSRSFKSIYEPVAMRAYYQGRTESARSVSQEKRQFIEAFFAKKTKENFQYIEKLFKKAIDAHGQRIALCQLGNGVERHLFGLKKIAEANAIDTDYFFLSNGMNQLQSNFISTTGIPSELLESFSFAPVNDEGFGLYYGLLEDRIILDISSKKEQAESATELLMALDSNLIRLGKLVGIEQNRQE